MAFVASDRPPCALGAAIADVDTPAAVVDLDAADHNIRTAVRIVRRLTPAGKTVMIRPHLKAHKSPDLARRQIELSGGLTVGVCCQKTVEAEASFGAGITDVFVCNQVVSAAKIARLAQLARRGARVTLLVDDAGNVRALSAAAVSAGCTFAVLVEVDVGQRRCGVASPSAAVALAAAIAASPGLTFGGIQAYHGGAQHVRTVEERSEIIAGVVDIARATVSALEGAGQGCPVVTGGGTGTFWMEAASGVFTEVQPGSYVLGDADYALNEADPATLSPGNGVSAEELIDAAHGSSGPSHTPTAPYSPRGLVPAGPERGTYRQSWTAPFRPALFLLTQVMSRRVVSPADRSSLAPATHPAAAAATASAAPVLPFVPGGSSSAPGGSELPASPAVGLMYAAAPDDTPVPSRHRAPSTTAAQQHSPPPSLPSTHLPAVEGWVVVDSGLKAQSTDSGPGTVVATVHEYLRRAQEKGALSAQGGGTGPGSGAPLDDDHAAHPCPVVIPWSPSLHQYCSSVGHLGVRSVSDEHSTLVPARPPLAMNVPLSPVEQRPSVEEDGHAPLPSSSPSSRVDTTLPPIGSLLLLQPGHCDPFMNHYDWLVGFRPSTSREGHVEAVWRVAARSPGV